MKKIEVTISPEGEIKVEAFGYVGADCVKATEFLNRALGKVKGRSYKPEFRIKTQQQQGN
jgi:hypothetical protein